MAKKPLSFKDFMVVDYLPGTGEYASYQAHKRKRAGTGGSNAEYASYQPEGEKVEEALTHAQRIKASIRMRKMKSKIKLGRQRALRKTPDMSVVKKRAMRQARLQLLRKLTRGASKDDLSFQKRTEIEKRLDKMKPRIDRLARKLIPVVRKKDRDRKASKAEKS